jgi:hypothetical protein
MRRLLSIAAAGVLALALAAPAMAGANTSNTSGSAQVVNGEWSSETGYGYAYFVLDSSYGAYGEFYEESGEYIACDDSGESYGFAGSRTYGWTSDVAIVLDSRLDHGSIAGTLELSSETVNECTGDYVVDQENASVAFSASLDGTGSVARFRDHGSFKVPGDYNSHSKQSGRQREATGSIELDGVGSRQFGWAILGDVKWSDHSNG